MKIIRKLTLIRKINQHIILIFVIILGSPSLSFSCSCDTISFEKAVHDADEIFVARIIKAERVEISEDENQNNFKWKYHLDVLHKWKGNDDSKLVLYQLGTSCDFWFDKSNSETFKVNLQQIQGFK